MNRGLEENRKFPRYKVHTPGRLEMFDDSFQISVENLSIGGLKIRSPIEIAPETYVAIRINVGRDIVFHCQVVWLTNFFDGKEHMYQMGLQIDAILDRGVEIIDIGEREILIQDLIIIMKRV